MGIPNTTGAAFDALLAGIEAVGLEEHERGKRASVPISPGTVFGRLTVIGFMPRHTTSSGRISTNRRVVCLCDCGRYATPMDSNLVTGRTRSCGCRVRVRREVSARTLAAMANEERRELVRAVEL